MGQGWGRGASSHPPALHPPGSTWFCPQRPEGGSIAPPTVALPSPPGVFQGWSARAGGGDGGWISQVWVDGSLFWTDGNHSPSSHRGRADPQASPCPPEQRNKSALLPGRWAYSGFPIASAGTGGGWRGRGGEVDSLPKNPLDPQDLVGSWAVCPLLTLGLEDGLGKGKELSYHSWRLCSSGCFSPSPETSYEGRRCFMAQALFPPSEGQLAHPGNGQGNKGPNLQWPGVG